MSEFLYLQALSVRILYNYIIAFVIWFQPWGEEQIKALSMLALYKQNVCYTNHNKSSYFQCNECYIIYTMNYG